MAKIRTNDGTFNVRGINRTRAANGQYKYELADEVGMGANPVGVASPRVGRREAGNATTANRRGV